MWAKVKSTALEKHTRVKSLPALLMIRDGRLKRIGARVATGGFERMVIILFQFPMS